MLDLKTEADFERFMEVVDHEIREDNIPVPWRPIEAARRISARFGLELPHPSREIVPTPGRYEGEELTHRIFRWFDDRYGERLKISRSPGRMPIVILGDVYLVIMPGILGAVRLICDPSTHGLSKGKRKPSSNGPALYNVLDAIEGLTPASSRSLSQRDLADIWQRISRGLQSFGTIEGVEVGSYWREVRGDLETSADLVVLDWPRLGQARWLALQAAEKAIKAFLVHKKQSVLRTHDLSKLVAHAQRAGFYPVPPSLLAKIQCNAEVRYDEVVSKLEQAVDAQHAALSLCEHVALQLPRRSGLELHGL